MGDASWCEEFYPVDANRLAHQVGDNPLALTQHSLEKWRGLRKSNLRKHGCAAPPIDVDENTCALCHQYYDRKSKEPCERCPLLRHLGRACDIPASVIAGCGTEHDVEMSVSLLPPFAVYGRDGNPEPMIAALDGTMEMLRREAEK